MRKKVLIIGNGITGITCARQIRKHSDFDITVISSESAHFYSRTALMYIYMGHMTYEHTKPYEDFFWEKNRINLVQARVKSIKPANKCVELENASLVYYDYLLVASGSVSNTFNWPGQDLKGVQGLYHLQDLQLLEENTKHIEHAVIVGGGLIGIEMAEMLLTRNIKVTFLIREKSFWNNVLPPDESRMVNDIIRHHGIALLHETELQAIEGDEHGRVSAVITSTGENIKCGFVALTVGVSPNISFLAGSGIEADRGILIDEYFQTSEPGIYAAGDCAQFRVPQPGRKPVEQVWYTGKMQGETAAMNILGSARPYRPGHWFNSAKFFNLEYQTYGLVPPKLNEGQDWFWWEDKKKQRGLRLLWDKNSGRFLGLNAMGIRISHEQVNAWLNSGTPVQQVVSSLRKANFDPEFHRPFEKTFSTSFKQVASVATSA